MKIEPVPKHLLVASDAFLIHVCMWHLQPNGVKREGQHHVFEPLMLQSGDEILVTDDDRSWVNVGGSLWGARIYSVAMHVERVRTWAKARNTSLESVEMACHQWPFQRSVQSGALHYRGLTGQDLTGMKFGKTKRMAEDVYQGLIESAQLLQSLFSQREWQCSCDISTKKQVLRIHEGGERRITAPVDLA